MKPLLVLITVYWVGQTASADLISDEKDWQAYKDIPTRLGHKGCVAETITEIENSSVKEIWKFQVIRLKTSADYSYPVMMAFPETAIADKIFEARAQSNREGSFIFPMIHLQPNGQPENMVAGRTRHRIEFRRRLENDKTMNVQFINHQGVLREVEFSLSGSFKAISGIAEACP